MSLANQHVFMLGVMVVSVSRSFMRTKDGSRKRTNDIPTLPQRGRVGLDFLYHVEKDLVACDDSTVLLDFFVTYHGIAYECVCVCVMIMIMHIVDHTF